MHIRLLGQGGAKDATVWDLAGSRLLPCEQGRRPSPTTSLNCCGAVTMTSSDSLSRKKRRSSNWA